MLSIYIPFCNLAVALGNAATSPAIVTALEEARDQPSALVREHVEWALEQHDLAHRSPQSDTGST